MQKEYEIDYKSSVKRHFQVHKYQKMFALAGFGAATAWALGLKLQLLSLVEAVGVGAGGLAIHQLFNRERSVSKAVIFMLAGLGTTLLIGFIPVLGHILSQATRSLTVAGIIGLIEIGIEKYQNRKNT